jgi:hypothetical protein
MFHLLTQRDANNEENIFYVADCEEKADMSWYSAQRNLICFTKWNTVLRNQISLSITRNYPQFRNNNQKIFLRKIKSNTKIRNYLFPFILTFFKCTFRNVQNIASLQSVKTLHLFRTSSTHTSHTTQPICINSMKVRHYKYCDTAKS